MQRPPDEFYTACNALGLDPEHLPLDKLSEFLQALLTVNEHCNLTAVRDAESAWMRHIFDSLTLVPRLAACDLSGERWVDVGTGGGLPAMVLAIVFPDRPLHMIEATGKKCRFLADTANSLGLENVTVHPLRAEEAGRDPALRESFDRCFSRAVSALNVLVELSAPLLQVGGTMMALKGEGYQQEIEDARHAGELLGLGPARAHPVAYSGGAILELSKVHPTPDKYPRKPGMPNKRPL